VTWLAITAYVIVLLNLAAFTFMAVHWLTEEYRRKHRLRRSPKGRMVPISSHPRYDDRRAS
jgi:hypothetical protein